MTRNKIYILVLGGKVANYKQNQYIEMVLKVVTERESNKF